MAFSGVIYSVDVITFSKGINEQRLLNPSNSGDNSCLTISSILFLFSGEVIF